MSLSYRLILLDEREGLFRLPTSRFARMLQDPRNHPLSHFLGARVRMAQLRVELRDRRAGAILQSHDSLLSFDEAGHLDTAAFLQRQAARTEVYMAPHIFTREAADETSVASWLRAAAGRLRAHWPSASKRRRSGM
jgi:hypothetical protein